MTVTLEEIKQKQTELEAMIKAYEEQEEAEFPKEGDIFWYIQSDGFVENAGYRKDSNVLKNTIAIGNCFRTQEEAEFAVEQLKVIAEQRKHGWKVGAIHFVNSEGKFNVHSFKVR